MINFSTNSNTFNPLVKLKPRVRGVDDTKANSVSTNKNTNSQSATNSSVNLNKNTNLSQNSNTNIDLSVSKFLVTDKSQAVGTSLGYGIDKDGYYTSDFNEAAGIPSDYKIHSSTMESFARIQENMQRGMERFISVDIAKAVGSAYKILSQVVDESILNSKDSFTKDEIAQFPQGYEFVQESFEVLNVYKTEDTFIRVANGYDYSINNTRALFDLFKPQPEMRSIFDNLNGGRESELGGVHWATTADKYTNKDGTITKGGLLIGIMNHNTVIAENATETEHIKFETAVQESGNDDEWLKNYKSPLMQMLEEIIKMQKELAQKALKKRLDTATQASAQNSNFVKDKSQATSEILGYGVDNEGFFTSDFNEAVGLDKDYKIYAKGVENLAQELATNKHFSQIELTKTLGNVYKLFSQLVPNAQTYDKEQISQIPLGFDYDTKSLTITQKHSSQNELSKEVSSNDSPLSRTQTAQSFRVNSLGKIDEIFEINSLNLGKNAYLSDGKVSKGGLFMAFAGAQLTQNQNGHIIAGNTTISGKLMGFDKNLSKGVVKDLNDFVGENGFLNSSGNTQEKFARMMKIFDLYNADLSVDEFKSQWLGLVNGTSKIDEKELKSFGEIIENFMKENGIQGKENVTLSKTESTNSTDKTQNESESAEQGFKRQIIQAKSKSPIYTQEFFAQYKNLLQDTQRLDTFNILFGVSSGANGNDLNTNLMSLNLSKIKPLNKVDIKA